MQVERGGHCVWLYLKPNRIAMSKQPDDCIDSWTPPPRLTTLSASWRARPSACIKIAAPLGVLRVYLSAGHSRRLSA